MYIKMLVSILPSTHRFKQFHYTWCLWINDLSTFLTRYHIQTSKSVTIINPCSYFLFQFTKFILKGETKCKSHSYSPWPQKHNRKWPKILLWPAEPFWRFLVGSNNIYRYVCCTYTLYMYLWVTSSINGYGV